MSDSQDYYWTPEWQGGEREADDDIESGRVKQFNSSAELITDLHSVNDYDVVFPVSL